MGARADELEYPPCEAAYLVNFLFEVGPVESGGMSPSPLSHREIEAWQRNVGVELNAWEATTLRRLSQEYLGMSSEATSPSCPPPWTPAPVDDPDHAEKVAKRVREMLRG